MEKKLFTALILVIAPHFFCSCSKHESSSDGNGKIESVVIALQAVKALQVGNMEDAERLMRNGALESSLRIPVRKQIQQGNVGNAIFLLNQEIDMFVVNYGADAGPPLIGRSPGRNIDRLLRDIAEYRKVHPSDQKDALVRAAVEKVLRNFQ